MNDITSNLGSALSQARTTFVDFILKLGPFLAIIVGGYFAAKLLSRLLNAALERIGFSGLVERAGLKAVLDRLGLSANALVSTLLFYSISLFVWQLAFSLFGPNPINSLLTATIAFLPNILAALLIIVVAAAMAACAKRVIQATLSGRSYGKLLANAAFTTILAIGILAALNQLKIAPVIVNGLFYAALAILAGSAIIAIGGGGIVPMRAQWEKALGKLQQAAPNKAETVDAPEKAPAAVQSWREKPEEVHDAA